jgi:glycosyltransferase involved in cell wall biosynthesis
MHYTVGIVSATTTKQKNTSVKQPTLISVIIPMKDEEENIAELYEQLRRVFHKLSKYTYEFIFVDDGSSDTSVSTIQALTVIDPKVQVVRLARNFGKEIATTAGLNHAKGEAAVIIDADLQHPPALIPELIDKWQEGYDVVIGRSRSPKHVSFWKRLTAHLFYKLINRISNVELNPDATDFRLLDRVVIDQFNRFTERNRMTRALIDWLGYSRTYVDFVTAKRHRGQASYGFKSLMQLAMNSMISLSFFPLRLAGYVGLFITTCSSALGIFVIIDKYILNDPLKLRPSGSAQLAILLLFMVGIVLICLGLIALYIANIYGEVANRPLYVEKRRPERLPE